MTFRAVCQDCGWTVDGDGREEVADQLDRHARKHHHHVTFERPPVNVPA